MERLLFEPASLDTEQVLLESRTKTLNQRDMAMVSALTSKHAIPARLRVGFAMPNDEPMLWLPDAVAGAVGLAHIGGGAARPRGLLAERVTEHDIKLT